jgi:hypothetical protein
LATTSFVWNDAANSSAAAVDYSIEAAIAGTNLGNLFL